MSLQQIILFAALGAALLPSAAGAAPRSSSVIQTVQPTCNLPESDAEALVILSNYYPGYWWDHTNLTIAVQAHPKATQEQLDAVQAAIERWSDVLSDCFDGLITLEDVTGKQRRFADIVVHFVPTAGGVVFGGYAICGAHGCPNVLVRSICRRHSTGSPTTPNTSGGSRFMRSAMRSVWATRRTCWKALTSWATGGSH